MHGIPAHAHFNYPDLDARTSSEWVGKGKNSVDNKHKHQTCDNNGRPFCTVRDHDFENVMIWLDPSCCT